MKLLTECDLDAGVSPAIGDTVILGDWTRCRPQTAVTAESIRGRWWRRPYEADGGRGVMLCVEQRDKDYPESCLAPALTYPLRLEGTYEIWVGTYRDVAQGGIDIKFSGDTAYHSIRPAMGDAISEWPPTDTGKLVECLWQTAALSGQDICLRQPHGTYGTFWWGLCNAHIAYLKLIRRDPAQVRREETELARLERKTVIWDRDGFSYIWQWGEQNLDCILQQVEMLRGTADILNWCIGESLFFTNFPHPMAGTRYHGGDRLGDHRYGRTCNYFEDQGIDVLRLLVERCHDVGMKIHASQRANHLLFGAHETVKAQHPEWLGTAGRLNYANEELQRFMADHLLYIPGHYDVDGLTIDFTRAPLFFPADQEDKCELMTRYLRLLRAGLDRVGRERGRPVSLFVSFECEGMYRPHAFRPRGWTPELTGLDIRTWVNERLVDCIMPEGKDAADYIAMCRGTGVMCCPRRSASLTLDGQVLRGEWQDRPPGDPVAAENKQDICFEKEYGPLEIFAGILKWYDAGADGVFLFNQEGGGTVLRHLRYPELMRQEIAAGVSHGHRVLGRATWTETEARRPT